jgi:hypothetical protein
VCSSNKQTTPMLELYVCTQMSEVTKTSLDMKEKCLTNSSFGVVIFEHLVSFFYCNSTQLLPRCNSPLCPNISSRFFFFRICCFSRIPNDLPNHLPNILHNFVPQPNNCPCVDCFSIRLQLKFVKTKSFTCGANAMAKVVTVPKKLSLLVVNLSFQSASNCENNLCMSSSGPELANLIHHSFKKADPPFAAAALPNQTNR